MADAHPTAKSDRRARAFAWTLYASFTMLGLAAVQSSSAHASPASSPEAQTEVLRLSTRVTVAAAPDDQEALGRRCESELNDLYLSASVLPSQSEQDPQLRVEISESEDIEKPGFSANLSIHHNGAVVEDSRREFSCDLCTHGEVAVKLRAEVQLLIDFWRAREAAASAGPTGPTGPAVASGSAGQVEGPIAPTGPDPTGPRDGGKRPLGPLGYAGIGGIGLGAAGVGVGAVFLARGVEPIGPDFVDAKDNKTPGAAAVGIGAGLLVTGAVLLVLDRVQAKRKAKANRAGRGLRWRGAM